MATKGTRHLIFYWQMGASTQRQRLLLAARWCRGPVLGWNRHSFATRVFFSKNATLVVEREYIKHIHKGKKHQSKFKKKYRKIETQT